MFKFGFLSTEAPNNPDGDNTNNPHWFASKQIKPEETPLKENLYIKCFKCGQFQVKYVSSEQVIDDLKMSGSIANSVLNAEQNHSDLITAVYEGGLKVWECTYDLINFFNETNLDFHGRNVLDLGCGAGLVGIVAGMRGAQTVFQDYNEEVVKSMTIPNVYLNGINSGNCAFYSGDWSSFLQLIKPTSIKFDYIFTSETIYNVDNYSKLISIFRDLLKNTGIVYLAAKSYYFGVGGSLPHFQETLRSEGFTYSTIWECSQGIKRAILEIKLK